MAVVPGSLQRMQQATRNCKWTLPDGSGCKAPATKGREYCRHHPPRNHGQSEALARIELQSVSDGYGEIPTRRPTRATAQRYIPPKLLEDFRRAMEDPDLLDLAREIAYVESRITELMRMFEDNKTTPEAYELMLKHYKTAVGGGQDAGAAMQALGKLIEGGVDEYKCQRAINEMIELKRRLLDTQARKMQILDQFLPKKQAAALGGALIAVLKKHITDQATRELAIAEVAYQFQRPATAG